MLGVCNLGGYLPSSFMNSSQTNWCKFTIQYKWKWKCLSVFQLWILCEVFTLDALSLGHDRESVGRNFRIKASLCLILQNCIAFFFSLLVMQVERGVPHFWWWWSKWPTWWWWWWWWAESEKRKLSRQHSPGRSVLKIHFFIESGLKWFNSKQNPQTIGILFRSYGYFANVLDTFNITQTLFGKYQYF